MNSAKNMVINREATNTGGFILVAGNIKGVALVSGARKPVRAGTMTGEASQYLVSSTTDVMV